MTDQPSTTTGFLAETRQSILQSSTVEALDEVLRGFYDYCDDAGPEVSPEDRQHILLLAKDAIVKSLELERGTHFFPNFTTDRIQEIINSVIEIDRGRDTYVLVPALAREHVVREIIEQHTTLSSVIFEAIHAYYGSDDLQAKGVAPAMGELLDIYTEGLKQHYKTGCMNMDVAIRPVDDFKELLTEKSRENIGDCALIAAGAFRELTAADYIFRRKGHLEYADIDVPEGAEELLSLDSAVVSDSVSLQEHFDELLQKGGDILQYARPGEKHIVANGLCEAFAYLTEVGGISGELCVPMIKQKLLKRFVDALPPEFRNQYELLRRWQRDGTDGAGFDDLDFG